MSYSSTCFFLNVLWLRSGLPDSHNFKLCHIGESQNYECIIYTCWSPISLISHFLMCTHYTPTEQNYCSNNKSLRVRYNNYILEINAAHAQIWRNVKAFFKQWHHQLPTFAIFLLTFIPWNNKWFPSFIF